MKSKIRIRSIYAKFVLIFLGIWWIINYFTFTVIFHLVANSPFMDLIKSETQENRQAMWIEFHKIRSLTGIIFFISALTGSIIIIFVVRGIIKPIKRLSKASKEVAKGNFDIVVDVKSMDEIGQLSSDFNRMTSELKSIDVLRKDFVSNVSHEYKTPITSIIGYAKLIQEGRLSENQRIEYSKIILNEGERLSILSSNMLKLSEIDSKVIQDQAVLYSLDEQIRKVILLLEVQWQRKEIEFDLSLEEIIITADKDLLHQVWLNLIQNAIKFSNSKDVIHVHLSQIDDMAVCKVIDQGIGIADSDKDRIFERFYKADKSRSTDGNGLGLVLVKKILELSNGKVYYDSKLGEGSTFVVELPIIKN